MTAVHSHHYCLITEKSMHSNTRILGLAFACVCVCLWSMSSFDFCLPWLTFRWFISLFILQIKHADTNEITQQYMERGWPGNLLRLSVNFKCFWYRQLKSLFMCAFRCTLLVFRVFMECIFNNFIVVFRSVVVVVSCWHHYILSFQARLSRHLN